MATQATIPMKNAIKPMLAASVSTEDLAKLSYPKIVQIKYDGIRAVLNNGRTQTRSGKLVPNESIQKFFADLSQYHPEASAYGLDGEILVGEPNSPNICMKTTSGVMSKSGDPDFTFYAFDLVNLAGHLYTARRQILQILIERLPASFKNRIKLVSEFEANTPDEVLDYYGQFIGHGLEGAILRDPTATYKYGRSTLKQQKLLKIKDFRDAEALVVGFEELHRNHNEATTNSLGYTTRSSHKGNLEAAGTLGALIVKAPEWNAPFRIGTGFDAAYRQQIWNTRHLYKGRLVKFKYLAAGIKDLPRHPVFISFRDPTDL